MARKPTEQMLQKMQAESHAAATVVVLLDDASPEMHAAACANLRTLAKARNRIWAWFEAPTTAAHNVWKTLTARRSETLAPIDAAIDGQKAEIKRYELRREAEQRAAEEARRAILALQPAATAATHMETALADPPPVAKQQGIVSVDVWKWRVIDQARIPERYKIPDGAKITKVVNAMKGQTEIPGIEVYQDRQIRALTS